MQLNPGHQALYAKEPLLSSSFFPCSTGMAMCRDPKTDQCLQLRDGLCSVQQRFGEEMLGDACHLYPRAVRELGGVPVMAATFSCPEIVRLGLEEGADFSLRPQELPRLPEEMRRYVEGELSVEACVGLLDGWRDLFADRRVPVHEAWVRLYSVARSLDYIPKAEWPGASEFHLRHVGGRLLQPEGGFSEWEWIALLMAALLRAAPESPRPRLEILIRLMLEASDVLLDFETLQVLPGEQAFQRRSAMQALVKRQGESWGRWLRQWSQGQVMLHAFPFSGLGSTPSEKAMILAVRFAVVHAGMQALLWHKAGGDASADVTLTEDEVVCVMQPLARFLDHLADPALSLVVFKEAGWVRESRLHGLLAHFAAAH